MAAAVFCVAKSLVQAERIVDQLLTAGGIHEREISMLLPDAEPASSRSMPSTLGRIHPGLHPANRLHAARAESALGSLGAGSFTGGVLGLLAGISALALPGIGPMIAAGPILAALSVAAAGAALGGIAGSLIDMGMPEFDARRYEDLVKGGSVLIAVHSSHGRDTRRIQEIFRNAGAEDISTTREHACLDL